MDYSTISTIEIITAVLCQDSVSDAVKALTERKENELKAYRKALSKEEASVRLLVEAMTLPEGTAGRTIADGIVAELRERFPEAAAAADKRIKEKAEFRERLRSAGEDLIRSERK